MKRALLLLLAGVVGVLAVIGLLSLFEPAALPGARQSVAPSPTTASAADPGSTAASGSTDSIDPDPVDSGSAAQVESQTNQPLPPADARPARVGRLADGDSFDMVWLDTDERDEVRMIGINAPEGDACFGDSARDVLQILIEDTDLLIEVVERDEFGRTLGNVWVGDLFVNATMVELGAALALSDGGRYASLITEAQTIARSESAGLWDPAECGPDSTITVRIGWIEANAPGPDNENKNGEWIEIVNDGASSADLSDWSIRDESTRHRFFFPDNFILQAGATVNVYSGCGDDGSNELYWCDDDPVWNNGGDTGFLVDPDGRFADSLSYSG